MISLWRHSTLLFLLLAGWACGSAAALEPSREYQVKAAFIYNFVQFVQWPPGALAADDAPLTVATLGADPFDGELDRVMGGKTVAGHTIVVKHYADLDHLAACQVLFVPAAQDQNLAQITRALGGKPVLTVGETDAFPRSGGCIRFYLEDGKVRFEINPDAAAKAALKISSKLLSLARIFKP
jgi:hypothetical protein